MDHLTEILQGFAANMTPGGAVAPGGSMGGSLSANADLLKALTASNYQTDVATLTGGGALGIQSLDTVMKTTIQEESSFTLFNKLQSTNATNIVDEFNRQTGIGGFLGGSTNTQMGVVRPSQGDYNREVGYVKFLMTMRQIGYVLTAVNNVASPMALEERAGALQLLTDAEYLVLEGNAAACPTEFDGVFTQLENAVNAGKIDGDHIINLDGAALTTIDPISQIGVAVSRYGNFGKSTDIILPLSVQNDLNRNLDPAFRWGPGQYRTERGTHVEGIRLQNGVVKTSTDIYLHDDKHPMTVPFEVNFSAIAASNAGLNPVSVTVDATVTDSASKFTASRTGNYYWAVAAIDKDGKGISQVVKSAQVAVASGKKAVLTITRSATGTESGYMIYRSRQNGTNTTNDFRLVKKIAASGGATTTFIDNNLDIPGTVKVPMLNLGAGADAIGWRQFQSMTKIPLPFGVGLQPVYSWFQFLFGYLRITKLKHHGYIKNVLPSGSTWLPH